MAKQVNYKKIDFVDSPEEITPIDEINLNAMQSNAENAINEVYNELLDSKLNTYVKIIANDILDQAEATEVLNNYEKFENKIIQFTKNGTNKTVLYGYVMEDNNSNKFLVVLDLKGKARQYNKIDYREYNVAYEINEGTVDINNITVNSIGDTAKYVSNLENATSKPDKSSAYGALMVLPFSHTKQIQLYIDVENNKIYTRKVEGSDTRHTFTEWKSFDDIIKALEEKQNSTDDEVNNLTVEVSDLTQKQTQFETEQKTQDEKIQKNVDNILAVDKKTVDNENRTRILEQNILDCGLAEGESPLNIKDSALSEMQEVEMQVAEAQKTTKGYNLFANADIAIEKKGVNFKMKNSILTIAGTSTQNFWPTISFYPDKTNTVSAYYPTKADISKGFFNPDGGKTYVIIDYEATEQNGTFFVSTEKEFNTQGILKGKHTLKQAFNEKIGCISVGMPSNNGNNFKAKISIVKEENENKPYEPYTGVQASPNPDYPQKINKIDKDFEFKTCGKNLFDGITEAGAINPDNGELIERVDRLRSKNFIKVKPNTTYAFTRKNGETRWIVGYDVNKKGIKDGEKGYSYLSVLGVALKTKKFKTSATTHYIKWYDASYITEDTVMIEQNTEVTPYEPYIETTTPIALKGNEVLPYDILSVKYSGGKYKLMLEKNSGKAIITGNENWKFFEEKNGAVEYVLKNPDFNTLFSNIAENNSYYENRYIICNYFIYETNNYIKKGNFVYHKSVANNVFWFIFATDFKTLEEFKSFLKANKVEIVYPLATPNTIQLAEFDNFNLMFNSITNIITSIDNVNLKVKYYRDFINTIRNLQVDSAKALGLEAQLQELENRVKALEAKQVVEQPLSEEEMPNDNNLRV